MPPSPDRIKRSARAWIGLALGICSAALIISAFAPARRISTALKVTGYGYLILGTGDNPSIQAGSEGSVALPTGYSIRINEPIFTKNNGTDRLQLRVEQNGHADGSSPLAGWQASVEASLQIFGVAVEPEGSIFQRLAAEVPAVFQWEVRGAGDIRLEGTLWVYLHLIPPDGGQPASVLLLARPVSITSQSILGLPAPVTGILGALGLLAGCGIGLPVILQSCPKAVRVQDKLDK